MYQSNQNRSSVNGTGYYRGQSQPEGYQYSRSQNRQIPYPQYSSQRFNNMNTSGFKPVYDYSSKNIQGSSGNNYQNIAAYSRNSSQYSVASRKKMSKGKKAAIIILTVFLLLLIGAGSAFAYYINHVNEGLTHGGKSNDEIEKINKALTPSVDYQSDEDVFYMLLLGSDTRSTTGKDRGRSDTNIVARVDPINSQVTLLSIPRDTKITIDGYGTQKFNAAYAFNGVAGAIEATEDLLGIDITHYAEVNFKELASLIDAVGGITVYNESKINNYKCDDGDGNHYIIEKGEVTLNGGEALTFARNRDYPDGDFTRQKHQRMVVEAIAEKVLTAPITSIPSIIEAAIKSVTTDLTLKEIISLAQSFANADEVTIYSCMLPSFTKTINGISFVINDEEKTAEMLVVFKSGGDPGDYKSTKTAADYVEEEDVSNVLLYKDDDEVVTGNANAYVPSYSSQYANSSNNTGQTNQGNASNGDGDNGFDTGSSEQDSGSDDISAGEISPSESSGNDPGVTSDSID